MFVSVIICTYNRSHLLKRVLDSLARQTVSLNHFEVVIVDDGSNDDTARICQMMHRELPNLKYLSFEKNQGTGSAANLGIQKAKGEILIFTDDDCVAKKDWLERMIAAVTRKPIIAGAVESPTSNYIKLCHNIAEFHRFMPGRKAGFEQFIAGANMGFKRSVMEELKGFRECDRLAVDTEFIMRARLRGYSIYFEPNAVVIHDHERINLKEIFKYASQHASETILLRNQYRFLLKTPFVLRFPFLIILFSPLIALLTTLQIYISNFKLIRFISTFPVVFGLKFAWCLGAASGLRAMRRIEARK